MYPRGDRLVYLAEPETEGSQWPPQTIFTISNNYLRTLKSRGLFLGIKGYLGRFQTHTHS